MLLNLTGYRLVISIMWDSATEQMNAAIDSGEYTEAGMVEIKIPLNMPYQERLTGFERHYGEITVEGKLYIFVKSKITGAEMILKCIPNNKKQQLKNASDILAKANSVQDTEQGGKKQSSSVSKIFSEEYDKKNHFLVVVENHIINNRLTADDSVALQDVMIKVPHQPTSPMLIILTELI